MTAITNFHYADGSPTPLSNFYVHPLKIDGETWRSVEHFFQASKTASVDDFRAIRDCATPGAAKKLGRKCALRRDWEAVKLNVMRRALEHKFVRGDVLGDWLLATGDALLVEGNTWGDKFWGVCDGQGQNWLGHLLMARRAELRGGEQ